MKYILITGVSTGIGFTTAQMLVGQGWFVFGSVRTEADAAKLETTLGPNFSALIFDVTDALAIEKAGKVVAEKVGEQGLFALINNAGISLSGPLELLDLESFRHQFEVNVFGVLKVTQVFLPLLKKAAHTQSPIHNPQSLIPKIINLSSVSGIFSTPFLGPYCASKFALEGLSDSLRRELLPFGVDVVLIQPGPVTTPIWEKARADKEDYAGSDYAPFYKAKDFLIKNSERRAIAPEVVARKILQVLNTSLPRTRYLMTSTPWQIFLLKILPDRWTDRIFFKLFQKLSKK